MPTIRELEWLAGLLEGEGCFGYYKPSEGRHLWKVRIYLKMTDLDVMERAAGLLEVRLSGPYISRQKRKDGSSRRPYWQLAVYGRHAVAWSMTLYPLMGLRRRQAIWSMVMGWKAQKSNNRRWVDRLEALAA